MPAPQPRSNDESGTDRVWSNENEIVARVVIADEGIEPEHDDSRRCVKNQQRLLFPRGSYAGTGEQRNQYQACEPASPHPAPCQWDAG